MYKFADTTPSSQATDLPSEALVFDGKTLEKEIKGYRTLTVSGRELHPTDLKLVESDGFDGSLLLGSKKASKIITVEYLLEAGSNKEFREKFIKLNQLLDKRQATFYFLDEEDKYFVGSKSDVESVPSGINSVISSFDIYCEKPYRYSKEEKTFTYAEPDFTSQPTSYTEGQTWRVEENHQVTVTSDYKGKSSGSDVGNPNSARLSYFNSLIKPNDAGGHIWEFPKESYDLVSYLNGNTYSRGTNINGYMAQIMFSYNVLEAGKRTFTGFFDGLTVAQQRARLISIIEQLTSNVWGRGTGPTGNLATFRRYDVSNNAWGAVTVVNSTNSIWKMSLPIAKESVYLLIDAQGKAFNMLDVPASTGTISSTVYLDYANLVTTFNNPHVGKLLRATKSSDTFNMADWELIDEPSEIIVNSEGTYQTEADTLIRFKAQTRYIALYSTQFLLQIGEPTNIENIQPPKTVSVVYDIMEAGTKSKWSTNVAKIRYDGEIPLIREGSFNWVGYYPIPNNFGPTIDKGHHGPSISINFRPLENWSAQATLLFKASKPIDCGRVEAHFVDQDNNFVAGIVLRDYSQQVEQTHVEFYVGDQMITTVTNAKLKNLYGSVLFTKLGDTFTFTIYNTKKVNGQDKQDYTFSRSFTSAEIGRLKIARFDYGAYRWKTVPVLTMGLTHFKVLEENQDNPNLTELVFEAGEEIFISGDDGNAYYNGAPLTLKSGSRIPIIMPGENLIEIEHDSDTQPEVEITIKDKYL